MLFSPLVEEIILFDKALIYIFYTLVVTTRIASFIAIRELSVEPL